MDQINNQKINGNATDETQGFINTQQPNTTPKFNHHRLCPTIFIIFLLTLIVITTLLLIQSQKPKHLEQQQSTEPEILLSQEDLQNTIQQLQRRPQQFKKQPFRNFKPSTYAYFAYNLHIAPTTKNLLAEYYYYHQKYNIGNPKYGNELPICIVSVGRNLGFRSKYQPFLQSIARLNYTNYQLKLVDDASNDNTSVLIQQYLAKKSSTSLRYKKLKDRTTLITNKKRMYALWNRDQIIRTQCREDDIVVEIDPDDSFIGAQPLKYINSMYHDDQVWVFYSNYVYWSGVHGEPTAGISQKIPSYILQRNIYRISEKWTSSATRTFRQKLYTKINHQDFIDTNFPQYTTNGQINKQKYYKWCADLFMHYSLIQLAGNAHYKHSEEIYYYYQLTHNPYKNREKYLDKLTSQMITPYQNLENLQLNAKRVNHSLEKQNEGQSQSYRPPQWIRRQWEKALKQIKEAT